MKAFLLICSLFFSASVFAQTEKSTPDPQKKLLKVEASCGQCKFDMKERGCDLAVRIDGKAYFVDGTSIDKHGDAHADDGFCNAVRKAEVQGEIVDNRFKATYFKVLPKESGK
jgi:hypothetical protein